MAAPRELIVPKIKKCGVITTMKITGYVVTDSTDGAAGPVPARHLHVFWMKRGSDRR